MSNSKLVEYTKISPNSTNPRKDKIKKITIHHMAGDFTLESIGNGFAKKSRGASANYGIDSNGRVAMYVEEKNRAWTSGSRDNDNQAITIEVANDSGAPDWHVSDKALSKLIDLCVDICKRNGIEKLNYTGDKNGNLTRHNMFQATNCPGPYLQSKFPYIEKEVNKRLNNKSNTYTVKKGDTLWGIAQLHNMTVDELKEINELKGDLIHSGDKLSVSKTTKTNPKKDTSSKKVTKNKNTWDYYINGSIVRELQRELNRQFGSNLAVDGFMGDKTINALVNVRKGARGDLTKIIQRRLKALGYDIGRWGADGIFGNSTDNAVKKFQKDEGLQVDGIVGKETWKTLFEK